MLNWYGRAWRNEHLQFYLAYSVLWYDYVGTKRNRKIPNSSVCVCHHSTKCKTVLKISIC